ncbi:molecular chaperone [Pantoea sp. M_9]|uniref:fimbrial biogenesis chaperone n=1 Tax=Pantoea sp. M_9 TaxID=2608041 RepID=UPI001232069C|nr:molecular chaperone [Pantoea sp. M_9]KAA5971612.1 molecular chaperone [Pantoea sp. M_9]
MKILNIALFSLVASVLSAPAFAGVQIGGTRVVYNEKDKEASVQLRNPDDRAFLVQSWTESEAGSPDKSFAVTPPLFRLDARQNNALRILFRGAALPADRESLYWLNVKAIPSTPREHTRNQLQLSVKTRIKLIYRPASLQGTSPAEFAGSLKWHNAGSRVTVQNDTPYYMNFSSVTLNGVALNGVTYVAPKSSQSFDKGPAKGGGSLEWKVFNDFGVAGQTFSSQLP